MRTFDRATFLAARRQWESGEYGCDWSCIRTMAAERGFIYPPTGSAHDDRDVENPSQRAVIYSALRHNPSQLEAIVRRSGSWSQVVDGIFGLEARLTREAEERERDIAWERRDEPTTRRSYRNAAPVPIRDIVHSIGDSL